MVLSIVICTYNRSSFLDKCISSVLEQVSKNNNGIEVLIIDNNSTDSTKQIAQKYTEANSSVRYISESNQGLSYARNRGINESKGDYIAFVDDDATIASSWLNSLLDGINQEQAKAFGGPILPNFEKQPPAWIDPSYFERRFHSSNGYLNSIGDIQVFSGGNMCISANVFNKIGGFDVTLGMIGNKMGLGEETEFFQRLNKEYPNSLYNIENMAISHFEPAIKFEKKYLKDRIYLSGLQFAERQKKHKTFYGFVFIIAKLIKQSITSIIYASLGPFIKYAKFKALKALWVSRGLWKGLFI